MLASPRLFHTGSSATANMTSRAGASVSPPKLPLPLPPPAPPPTHNFLHPPPPPLQHHLLPLRLLNLLKPPRTRRRMMLLLLRNISLQHCGGSQSVSPPVKALRCEQRATNTSSVLLFFFCQKHTVFLFCFFTMKWIHQPALGIISHNREALSPFISSLASVCFNKLNWGNISCSWFVALCSSV